MAMDRVWYRNSLVSYLLLPLTIVFWLLSSVRRMFYRLRLFHVNKFSKPVIVVGNISVGGTGKTPLVIWLVSFLKSQGYRPGVVARGYGGKSSSWPQQVRPGSDTRVVGDEAVLLASKCDCPVCVGPDRSSAVRALLQHTECNIVVSDDGLQHYAMGRDMEIVVIDGNRRFGNGMLLPSGPLRELPGRLKRADLVVSLDQQVNDSYIVSHRQPEIYPLGEPDQARPLADAINERVHAIAGIGHPQRFFDLLIDAGLAPIVHAFPDHHNYSRRDLQFEEDLPLVMTEKDAVKCAGFELQQAWVIRISAQPEAAFIQALDVLLKDLDHG